MKKKILQIAKLKVKIKMPQESIEAGNAFEGAVSLCSVVLLFFVCLFLLAALD
jgi:hypothetical protein